MKAKTVKKREALRRPEKFTPIEIAMALCLAVAVVYTLYLIFTKLNPYGLNSDVVNEISYRRLTWEQKTLFPKGYVCGQESLSTRPVLLYWLFYAITHKFLLSFQLEDACTFFLELAAIYYFLTKLKVSRAARFFSLFLVVTCLAFAAMQVSFWTMNANVLFMISIFLTLALRISLKEAETTRDKLRLAGLMSLLAAVLAYGTVKMILYLYLPLVVLDVGRLLCNYFKRVPIGRAEWTQCAASLAALGVTVLFYALFLLRHSDFIWPLPITIAGMDKWFSWEVVSAQFRVILQCFGIVGGGKLTSLTGIQFVLSVAIAAVELVSILWLVRNGSEQVKDFMRYVALVAVGIIAFHVLPGTVATSVRYYSVVAIAIHPLCGCAISEWMGKGKKLDIKPLAAVAAIVALFLGIRAEVDRKAYSGVPALAQVADYAVENGYQYAVGGYWNAGILTGYSDGRLETWHSGGGTPSPIVTLTPQLWLIDTNLFTQERLGEQGLLILTDLEEKKILEDDSYVAILLNEYAEKVTEIDVYNLYAVTENPYTLIEKIKRDRAGGLPTAEQTEKTDRPGNVGFRFLNNAELNENGELVSDGATGGIILYGPYSETVPGVYDITLNYTVEAAAGAAEGTFDVALDTQRYAAVSFTAGQTSATLEDVSIEAGHKFEARVSVPAGMVIRVQSIHYTRVG